MDINSNKPKGHMGSTIKFLSSRDKDLFLKDFNSESQINKLFNSWKYENTYDVQEINFKDAIINELTKKRLIDLDSFEKLDKKLEKIHLCLNEDMKNLDESEQNKISVSFYETSDSLNDLYYKFIREVISPKFQDNIYFQAIPTFRFHFPNQEGYDWNDRYHTDIMLGHPPFEFNVWLPFTNVYSSNSMRITSYEDSMSILKSCNYNFEDFAEKVQYDEHLCKLLKKKSYALELKYGEFIIFDPRCLHCTQHNVTKDTRISMDIRIITRENLKKYSREYRTTGRKKMLFQPGHYFSKEYV